MLPSAQTPIHCSNHVNVPGKCPRNSAAGKEIGPPVGYTYNAATDKYYKPYKVLKDWGDSQMHCSSDGATLIESRTHAGHEALNFMYSK